LVIVYVVDMPIGYYMPRIGTPIALIFMFV